MYGSAAAGAVVICNLSRESVKMILKLTLRVIVQKQSCDVPHVHSVQVVLNEATLRVITLNQWCDVSHVRCDNGADASTS